MIDTRHIRRLVRALDPEPEHAIQVCRNALALFDATEGLHGLGAAERRVIEAAALLHDIGYTVDARGHHKHSRDVIMKLDLPKTTQRERRMVACIARYHRKAHPAPAHVHYADLQKGDRRRVDKLAALLRIADGLDRSHERSCKRIAAEAKDGAWLVRVKQRKPNAVDIWGAQRKRGLFEEVFGVRVTIETAAAAKPAKKARP